jgi:hypothetical protein
VKTEKLNNMVEQTNKRIIATAGRKPEPKYQWGNIKEDNNLTDDMDSKISNMGTIKRIVKAKIIFPEKSQCIKKSEVTKMTRGPTY